MNRFKPCTLSTNYTLKLLEYDFVLTGLAEPVPRGDFSNYRLNTLVVNQIRSTPEGVDLSFFYKPSPRDEGSPWDHWLHIPTDVCVFSLERPHVLHILRVFPHQVTRGPQPDFVNRFGIWLKFAQLKGYEGSRTRYLY